MSKSAGASPYIYIVRSSTPDVTLPIEMDPTADLQPSELRVTNSYGSKTARVRYLEKILVGPDSVGGEIDQALLGQEQPFVVVDNVIKASRIFQVLSHVKLLKDRCVVSVSGLSGAGKSEFSSILGSYLIEAGYPTYILSLDNYYHRTSPENTEFRTQLLQDDEQLLFDYLGTQEEIDLSRVSALASQFKQGATELTLRQMDLREGKVTEDALVRKFDGIQVLLIEGTWGLRVESVDAHILLASRPDLTLLRRIKRGREPITPEVERVVLNEQKKLTKFREHIDIEIYDDYFIEFPSGKFGSTSTGQDEDSQSLERLLAVQHRELVSRRGVDSRLEIKGDAPYCPIPSVPTKDASTRALEVLRDMTTSRGILASSAEVSNYQRIWARDSVVSGLGGLMVKDEQLIRGLKASLDLLAESAGDDGQIPSNVSIDRDGQVDSVSYGGLAGRVDTIPWYVIGVCQYAAITGDEAFLLAHKPTIEHGLKLLSVWEFNNNGLVYMPQGGDWADEYIFHGYVFLSQTLRLWALQCYAELTESAELRAEAKFLRELLEVNYWPLEENRTHKLVYHQKAFASFLENREASRYFEACLNPNGYSRQFDFLGNSIACLLKLGSDSQRKTMIEAGQSIVNNLSLRLCPAFWPPIFETDPEWPLLRLSFKEQFRNEPFQYHNGGSWPMVTGWWGSALLSEGLRDEATGVLNTIHVANSMGLGERQWEFNECFMSVSGQPEGVTPCAWSAAAPLMLGGQLQDTSRLQFCTI